MTQLFMAFEFDILVFIYFIFWLSNVVIYLIYVDVNNLSGSSSVDKSLDILRSFLSVWKNI